MDPWLEPWKPFFPIMKMSLVFPLVNTIPVILLLAIIIVLGMLLILYYVCLIIQVWPWHSRKLKKLQSCSGPQQSATPFVKHQSPKNPRRRH